MSKNKGQTFMFGAVILMISNIAVKLIGAFLRIPLTNIIGTEGMAYYNAAYNVYATFYTISTAGIPVAVSRMIATANSKNNQNEIKKIFRVTFVLFLIIGFIGTVAMILFSKQFANDSKMPEAFYAMLAIAPTVFFICLSSAYRGYFQGVQNMVPTAISQVIESVVKMGIGIISAWYFYKVKGYPLHITAAFVIVGVTIGVLLGALYGAISKAMYTRSAEYKNNALLSPKCERTWLDILKELVLIAIPVTLASSIMGFTNLADTRLLSSGLQAIGFEKTVATSYYGTYSSMVYPLFNLVPPFIYTFGISAIPAITASIVRGDKKKIQLDIESAFRNCAIIAIPSAIGLATLSKGIICFLFAQEPIGAGKDAVMPYEIAAPALSTIAAGILFLGVISITNSVLQAYKAERYTIYSMLCGVALKFVSLYFLVRVEGLNLLSAAISTLLCYFTIMCINLFFMIKKTGFVPKVSKIFVKPLISGVLCGVVAFTCNYIMTGASISGRICTFASIAAAAVVYVALLLLLKGLNRYDVMMMPKGEKLCKILDKFSLLDEE